MYECRVESPESTRQRAESLQSRIHEDRVAREGFTSIAHNNLVHKFIPMPQAKFWMRKQEWTRNGKSSRQLQHGMWKNQEQIGAYSGSTKRQKESPLSHTDGGTSEHKQQKYEGRVVPRGDIVKDDSAAYAVFCRARLVCVSSECRESYGYFCKITRLWRTSS